MPVIRRLPIVSAINKRRKNTINARSEKTTG